MTIKYSELLTQLAIQPVFTAHPTETTRRTILRKQQNIVRRMVDLQNPALTPQEHHACFESIRADVTAIWQTDESPREGLTVFDELEHTLFFATDVIYQIIPPFYEAIETALTDIYGDTGRQIAIPNMLHFGSWIGGDFSTDPELSARTVREVLRRHNKLILDLYFRDCKALGEKLSQSDSRVDIDDAVLERTQAYARQFPGAHGSTPFRYRKMPYRVFLRLICERLQATYDEDAFAYESPQQLIDDLNVWVCFLELSEEFQHWFFTTGNLEVFEDKLSLTVLGRLILGAGRAGEMGEGSQTEEGEHRYRPDRFFGM